MSCKTSSAIPKTPTKTGHNIRMLPPSLMLQQAAQNL